MNPPDVLLHLPHGPEFRFVDRIVTLVPGQSGMGEYKVKGDEAFLKGHFPNQPLFPGVLLVEAAAQLAGCIAQSDPIVPKLPGLKLTAIRAIKILGTARPSEMLLIHAQIRGRLENLVQAEVRIHLNGECILTGEVTLSGDPPPKL
jgi:3-hydroxyacyl-[acyl-carrier-protein] dehydratase